jgi:ABC-type multidrug transport system permease subunit
MLRALIAKDLRRAWRNPLPWLINLALPLFITAMVGFVFGGRDEDTQLGRIHFAVVDEDHDTFSQILRNGLSGGKATNYFDPVYLDRETATRQLNDSALSAVLIIPASFTSNYLNGQSVTLQLIKNPAEQIYPAALEETLGVLVTGMNAVSRNLLDDAPTWRRVVHGEASNFEISLLAVSSRAKFHAASTCLFPPLVSLSHETEAVKEAAKPPTKKKSPQPADFSPAAAGARTSSPSTQSRDSHPTKPSPAKGTQPKFNIFAYILVGMTAMFLLLLANRGVADLHREVVHRTSERYHTLRDRVFPFIVGKAFFTAVITGVGAAILLGGGGIVFHIHWPRPVQLAIVTAAYACFATGLTSLLTVLVSNEKHADALNNIVAMALAIGGGCWFPTDWLPPVFRNYLAQVLPTYWYAQATRELWWSSGYWWVAVIKLMAVTFVCLVLAAYFVRRNFLKGHRA